VASFATGVLVPFAGSAAAVSGRGRATDGGVDFASPFCAGGCSCLAEGCFSADCGVFRDSWAGADADCDFSAARALEAEPSPDEESALAPLAPKYAAHSSLTLLGSA
jgi:hypothetical protein